MQRRTTKGRHARMMNPRTEHGALRLMEKYALAPYDVNVQLWCTRRTRFSKKVVDFHTRYKEGKLTKNRKRVYRLAHILGYQMLEKVPTTHLEKLHQYADTMPKNKWWAVDLAALNVYLQEVAGIDPIPFARLVTLGWWQDGSWREQAKRSVLYPCIR